MLWYLPIAPDKRASASYRPPDPVHARPAMTARRSTLGCRALATAGVPNARHATRSDVTKIVRTLQLPVRVGRGHPLDVLRQARHLPGGQASAQRSRALEAPSEN